MARDLAVVPFICLALAAHAPTIASAQSAQLGHAWLEVKSDANREAENGEISRALVASDISEEGLACLQAEGKVIELTVGFFPDPVSVDAKVLSKIGDFKDLRGLEFYVVGACKGDWSFLSKLTKLEYLQIDGERLSLGDDFIKHVAKLKSLRTLRAAPNSRFSDKGISQLSSLPKIEELQLSSPLMTRESLKTIRALQHLRVLDLTSPQISRQEASKVLDLSSYEKVSIGNE